jgi:SAM-dependent methyltransferase
MTWEERITQSTAPAIANEHVVRYGFAAALLNESSVWADLGCGTGVAAARALENRFRGRLILVDVDENSMKEAQTLIAADEVATLRADLSEKEDLQRVRAELLARPPRGDGCITCFEVIEHLSNFAPLLELLVDVSENAGFTVFVSVPNDAFWSLDNPHHRTTWSGEAFEEFRRNLPSSHVLAHQLPITGSCLHPVKESALSTYDLPLTISSEGIPSHYVTAFGPRATWLEGIATVVQVDLERQRAWERQREADLTFYRTTAQAGGQRDL